MNKKLNPNLKYLGTETAFGFAAKVIALESEGKFPKLFKFNVGDTGPKTTDAIIEVAIQALRDKQTKYGHFLGFRDVRQNIANYISETRGVEVKPEQVMMQPSGKPVIELAMQSLLGPNDAVVGQNPGYPIYESLAKFYTQGKYIPWFAKKKKTGGIEFFVKDLEKILSENNNVKLLIVNTPQNPTGIMLTENKLKDIADLVKKYDIMVLFDDIYDRIVFKKKKHFSILSVPGMIDRTINLNGFSKNYAMTGWRVGFIVAPEWLIDVFGKFAINKWSCVNPVHQIVAGTIFGDVEVNGKKYKSVRKKIEPILQADYKEYEKKGKFLYECLKLLKPYLDLNPPEGAFYLFPNISNILRLKYVKTDLNIKDENDFVYWLLYKKGIAVLAGPDFGEGGKGHIRFSYAEDREEHIIPGIKHFVNTILELIEKSGIKPPISKGKANREIDNIKNNIFNS